MRHDDDDDLMMMMVVVGDLFDESGPGATGLF